MGPFRVIVACVVAGMLSSPTLLVSPPARGDDDPGRQAVDLVLVIDQSKSMSKDAVLEEAKRAASLACVLLRGRVAVVGFSDEAILSPTFDLGSQRDEALRWIEGLQAIGGTKYAQALEAAAPLA